jgi:hypothetical protein
MNPINKIDYSKFKVQIYSPDGEFICDAMINKYNAFYCPELIAGQPYDIIFSYDDIFLMAIAFNSENTGKVSYLSPAHILIVNEISKHQPKAGSDLATKVKRREEYKVPLQQWEKWLLENIDISGQYLKTTCHDSGSIIKYKAGNDLASKVK